jgi:4-amino-4-deoxy-L-arabinose transferase-like glycosyltransferase
MKVNAWLAVLVTLYVVLGAIYSLVVPLFEAPDEIWHFNFIRVVAKERTLPVQPREGKDMWLREVGQPPLYHLLGAAIAVPLDTSDFPDYVRFNVAHPAVTAGSESKATNVFIHTPHEAFPYRGSVLAVHLLRFYTLLWGAATVVGTYAVAREVAPGRPSLALAAAAVTALNPHFIFISSVINNDAAIACLGTWTLWAAVRLAKGTREESQGSRLIHSGILGLLLGLSLLSKVSALALLPLTALALTLAWWRKPNWRATLLDGAMIYGLAALVAGWWFVRNWRLYGDPLGWSVWLIDIGVQRISLAELIRQFGHVATSYVSPYDGLYPAWLFWTLGLLLTVAIVGWVRLILAPRLREALDTYGLLLAGAWIILLFASLVRYMTTTPSAEGRLLYPGIAAISTLLVLGWDAVLPRRWARPVSWVLGAGLFALCLATPFFAIAPRYALPRVTQARELEGLVPIHGGDWGAVRLLGVRVTPQVAQPGDTVEIELYWEARDTPSSDLQTVVRLWTAGNRLLGQWHRTPAEERYPPDLWQAGDIVRDEYRLPVGQHGPALYSVDVSVRGPERVLLNQASSGSSRTRFKLAPASWHPSAATQIRPTAYVVGDKVELLGYELPAGTSWAEDGLPIALYWRVRDEIEEDYSIFVHLLDADGTLIGQGDGPPLGGDYPTSGWSEGEELVDVHLVQPKEATSRTNLPEGSYLLIGLYHPSRGERLPALDYAGHRIPHDAMRLDVVDRERP